MRKKARGKFVEASSKTAEKEDEKQMYRNKLRSKHLPACEKYMVGDERLEDEGRSIDKSLDKANGHTMFFTRFSSDQHSACCSPATINTNLTTCLYQ